MLAMEAMGVKTEVCVCVYLCICMYVYMLYMLYMYVTPPPILLYAICYTI
jgi:hypothetical protein